MSTFKAPFDFKKMPETPWNESTPPKNGSHCGFLFSDHRNGFKTVPPVNGCVSNGITACNGFHDDIESNHTRPEKTVGFGRPRCHPQAKRVRSFSESASEDQDDRLCHGVHSVTSQGNVSTSRTCTTPGTSLDARCFSHVTIAHYEDCSAPSWLQEMRKPQENRDLLPQYSGSGSLSRDMTSPKQFHRPVEHHSHRHCHYRNRYHLQYNNETKLSLQERLSLGCHDSLRRQLQVAREANFDCKVHPDWWNQNMAPVEDESYAKHENNICELLQNNGPMASSDIALFVGVETKIEVNHCLYNLHKKGRVRISDGNPPLWEASDHFTYGCARNPGVIGGERKSEALLGRRSQCEDLAERPRRHSYNAYESKPRKEPRGTDSTRPWTRSNNLSPSAGERTLPYFCRLCKLPFPSEAQYEEHLRSTKHQNKVAKYSAVPYKKFCEYCKVHLNSESQAREHFNSGRHEQTVAKSQKAPHKQHLPLVAVAQELNLETSTKTEPYVYQMELYSKAMKTNAVCFLPTGTGKTLVAALVIAHMLKLNPSRQVVFLVDRVLLVLQQSDYLRKELSHIRVADEGSSNSFNSTRPIRIGAVCGEMRKLEGNARIYEQDVLIITADCYRNHLNNGTLRFDDVSLIVLDEAHHCNKDHPYNVIIRDFYLREDDFLGHRPKVLGLTASPAGELSLDKTTKRLQRLIGNLGDAQLLSVTSSVRELEEKTSKASPNCISAPYTQSEMNLKEVLMEYVTKAFNMAVRLSEMKDYKDIFQPSSGGLFSIDDIHPVLRVIDNLVLSRHESSALSSLLHFQLVCEAVCTLQECGEKVALDQMAELAEDGCPHGFHWAEKMCLPSSQLWSYLERCRLGPPWRPEFEGTATGADQLVQEILKESESRVSSFTNGCVLVLVNRKRTAEYLAAYLNNCPELRLRNIGTTSSVGHVGGSDGEDLATFNQREIIKQIQDGHFQVIVTTSLSEEGLDLPRCQLVFQMSPPGSVQALAQMRGRVLLTRFVCICRNDDQAKKIEDLLRREENMKRAVRNINGF